MKSILIILFLTTISSVSLLSEEAVKSDSLATKKTDSLKTKKYLFSFKTEFPQIEFNALQSTNEELLEILPEDAEISKDFPVAPLYKLEMSFVNYKSSYFSILAFYHSAESNINYEDNSGELNFNISAKTYGVGFGFTNYLKKDSKTFNYGLNLEIGMLNKFYRFESDIYVAGNSVTEVYNFSESSMYFSAGLLFVYQHKYFMAGAYVNYLYDFRGRILRYSMNSISHNGLRQGLVLSIKLNSEQKIDPSKRPLLY